MQITRHLSAIHSVFVKVLDNQGLSFGEWYLFVKIDKTKNIDKANIDTPSLPAALRQTRAS